MTGALWAASYYRFGLTENLAYSLFFVTILVLLSAIDYQTKIIPDRVLLPSMAVSAVLLLLYFIRLDVPPLTNDTGITGAIVGFLGGGGMLLAIAALAPLLFKKEAMGGGDIKLAAFMGLYLGGYVFMAVFLGSLLGAVAGVVLMTTGKVGPKDMIPFGPFLAAGAILTVFFGPQLWAAYLKLAGF
jgi:prepilin signal peptidase PulO-like enzyme (type II secretory pathway)